MLEVATRVLRTAVAVNVTLILASALFAPSVLSSPAGVGEVVADVGLQVVVLGVGLFGPVSLERLGDTIGYCLAAAVAFAVVYDALLLLDFAGHPQPLSPYLLFGTAAGATSGVAAYRTRSLTRGVLAAVWSLVLGTTLWSGGFMAITYAFWGTRSAYLFWARDGAINEFHRSGAKSLPVFLLQDLQGALFFHPILSLGIGLALGTACGAIGRYTQPRRPRHRSDRGALPKDERPAR